MKIFERCTREWSYVVDFSRMVQTNTATGKCRKIRCVPPEPEVALQARGVPQALEPEPELNVEVDVEVDVEPARAQDTAGIVDLSLKS